MNMRGNIRVRATRRALCAAVAMVLAACGTSGEKTAAGSSDDTASAAGDSAARVAPLTVTFTPDQYTLAGIEVGGIEMRNLSTIIKLNGIIDAEPSNMAVVSAPLGGYVRTAGLIPGQVVRKGQVLATLENPEFTQIQQDFLEGKGRMEFLEQEFLRQEKLRAEDVNATKTFQQVTSERNIMRARLAGLEQRMALAGIPRSATASGTIARTANLYAPISGYIRASNVSIGKYVSPTDVLFEIVDTRELHLALNAYEKDLGQIAVGQTVRFSMASENTFNRTAKVFLIGRATGDDRAVLIHCDLAAGSGRNLLPGMYAKAWIETGTEQQLSVSTDAIVQFEGKFYIVVQTSTSNTTHAFQLVQIRKATEQEGYTGIIAAAAFDLEAAQIVVKNANSVLAAIRNAQEGE